MASGGFRRDLRPAEGEQSPQRYHFVHLANWAVACWRSFVQQQDPTPKASGFMRIGVLRNDRTPLNTPYTPQLVKLQLRRHDEHDDSSSTAPTPASAAVATIRASVLHLLQPFRHVRSGVDRVVGRVLPSSVEQSAVFRRHRAWVVSYITTVLCIPFVMLLSPMVIAFCICTLID
ncbi:hypothetical protein ATCC90586_002924 [Pythium insidiosum]|nr:hypothetical protein ATCC90586_002924 [Pythium insidiosum]